MPVAKSAKELLNGLEKMIMEQGIIFYEDDYSTSDLWEKMMRGLFDKKSSEGQAYIKNLGHYLQQRIGISLLNSYEEQLVEIKENRSKLNEKSSYLGDNLLSSTKQTFIKINKFSKRFRKESQDISTPGS